MKTVRQWYAMFLDEENFSNMFTFRDGECDVNRDMVTDFIKQIILHTLDECKEMVSNCAITGYAARRCQTEVFQATLGLE